MPAEPNLLTSHFVRRGVRSPSDMNCLAVSYWRRALSAAIVIAICASTSLGFAKSDRSRVYLSGHGPKDAVPWDFTITGGRRAGEKTTIPVPSNWELHGFGSYHYGQQRNKSDEHGLYRTRFATQADWKGQRVWLVFEGVMTDATVTVNGRSVGPTHQGGFYRFRYEITALIKPEAGAENVVEVDVAKVSANAETERAERGGDYWVFGGIYRPVWLQITPPQAIDHFAIDARADGSFTVDVDLAAVRDADRLEAQITDINGKAAGAPFSVVLPAGGTARTRLATKIDAPALWTAETPTRYWLHLKLLRGNETLDTSDERFGFRTFEVREGRGLFLNGQRILLKGVNRHSFRPETGRALNVEDCYADARLLKEMNMNAVRMSHYPPDEMFLEVCDEVGLYVLDELSGWQKAHGTANGRLLVREMIERDVNHPSILFWDNGNEGGWNRDLDGEFALYDPQHRRVLHPWELHDGVNTKHYPNYDELAALLKGRDLVMPTEVLHGLYDGGVGAGLETYWHAIATSPVGAGAFIWDLADEGVVRTDQGGRIDVFSTFAPDGIVGPHFEREGSFYTVRDVWSPVQIDPLQITKTWDGTVVVHNRYDFTSLAQCRFEWQLVRFAPADSLDRGQSVIGHGEVVGPAVAPHADGQIKIPLPSSSSDADALVVKVVGPNSEELWTCSWPLPALKQHLAEARRAPTADEPRIERGLNEIRLVAGDLVVTIDGRGGLLREVSRGQKKFALTEGPRLAFAKPPSDAGITWRPFAAQTAAADGISRVIDPAMANFVEVEVEDLRGADAVADLKLEISSDGTTWKTIFDASRRPQDGVRYEFAPQRVAAVRLTKLRRWDGRPPVLKSYRLGYSSDRFPGVVADAATITSGDSRGLKDRDRTVWVEAHGGPSGLQRLRWTLAGDGALRVDYDYSLAGHFAYHGVTFDHPEAALSSFRWLGAGPYRVYQNRLRGTTFGVHEHRRHDLQPGETWEYPEYEGYYSGWRWARFTTDAGDFLVNNESDGSYLRVGTPRVSAATTTVDFPPGEISFVAAIPAIGSKGKPPERAGPGSQYATAEGTYQGSLTFYFGSAAQR